MSAPERLAGWEQDDATMLRRINCCLYRLRVIANAIARRAEFLWRKGSSVTRRFCSLNRTRVKNNECTSCERSRRPRKCDVQNSTKPFHGSSGTTTRDDKASDRATTLRRSSGFSWSAPIRVKLRVDTCQARIVSLHLGQVSAWGGTDGP